VDLSPQTEVSKSGAQPNAEGESATDINYFHKLDSITYEDVMSCLIKTGLLQRVLQLPNAIDINNPDEEGIIRLCMKLLISIIFKGQSR
jgi:hypothetical protein